MNKELTPLEALEILKEANTIYCGCASNLFARYRFEIETIETALKALEIIKEHIIDFSFNYGGKMGNVIKIRIGDDIIRLYFQEGDKNFEIIKEFLYA